MMAIEMIALTFQIVGHILQLWNVVLIVSTFSFHDPQIMHMFSACILDIQVSETSINCVPVGKDDSDLFALMSDTSNLEDKTYQVFISSKVYSTLGIGVPLVREK